MRSLLSTLLILSACTQPPPKPDVEFYGHVEPLGETGWSTVHATATVTDWVWQEDARLAGGGEWVESSPTSTAEYGLVLEAAPTDGGPSTTYTRVPGRSVLWQPDQELAPGAYDIRWTVNDAVVASVQHQVGAWGQLPPGEPLDIQLLDGAVFTVDNSFIEVPPMVGEAARAAEPMVVRLRVPPPEEGADDDELVTEVWVPGEQGLCRVWTGWSRARPGGRVVASLDEAIAASGVPIGLYDAELMMGLDNSADEVHGVRVSAIVDTATVDPLFEDPEEGPQPGRTAQLLEDLGVPLERCEDSRAQGPCARLMLIEGEGLRDSETDVLQRYAPGARSLNELPACQGGEPGELFMDFDLTCSTVGSLGLGAWFAGVGVLLFRRRRDGADG